MANEKDLQRAQRTTKQKLSFADLSNADLRGVNFNDADLGGANLSFANLSGVYFRSANLKDANLNGADLTGAYFGAADLRRADMGGVNASKANFHEASLSGASMTMATLTGASLRGCDLFAASLAYATLDGARLIESNLSAADLSFASLSRADLSDAGLQNATLERATMRETVLVRADLTGANLRKAELYGADLTDANLDGANLDGANLTKVIGLRGSRTVARGSGYGRASGAVLKLLGEGPQAARDYKRKHPAEFERLKALTGGRDFDAATIKSIVAQTRGARWLITKQAYGAKAQRLCPKANDVLLFNIDLEAQNLDDEAKAQLRKLSEVSRRSGHPHEKGDKLFTVGWVRYCDGGKTWLVEEVQSDVYAARYGLKDEKTREQLRAGGISPEQFERAIEALKPWTERFYEDALGVTFALAKQRGIAVEMLTYESKQEFGSPKALYTDLPRSMGMTRRERGEVLDAPAWYYRPNPRRKIARRR